MPETAKPFLAFDLGAESGRAILGHLQNGLLTTQEIHRFKNGPVQQSDGLHWNVAELWQEMRAALTQLNDTSLAGIGVDAWGVDYALLGASGELLENPYHYRDSRTTGMIEEVCNLIPREEIYRLTGIQFMPINTLYQLCAARRDKPALLKSARCLITIPDLFHYWLTGKTVCEFTNASTTQLVNPRTRTWSRELIERLDLPSHVWCDIVEPGTVLGSLLPSVSESSALAGTPVIVPATHDTGSAVAGINAREGTAFLSSGTWSLLGTELDHPVITADSLRFNFTNEGGVNGTTRLLKNVMGLWMLQSALRAWASQGHAFSYAELLTAAGNEPPFHSLVDPDHESFLRAGDMPAEIDHFCARTGQPSPNSPASYVRTILESLACKYRLVVSNLESLLGRRITHIRVIGGGSRNRLLNQFVADSTGRTVLAGLAEAAALGNIAMQILATGAASSLHEVRDIIGRSYPVERFEPLATDEWDRHAARFEHYCEAVYA